MDNPIFVDDKDIPPIDDGGTTIHGMIRLIQAGLKKRCLLLTLNSQRSG